MPRGKKELAEQIIPKLREVEVEVGRGKTVANDGQEDRCDGADVLHGGLRIDQAKRLQRPVRLQGCAGKYPQ